jgi:hypothetical protein
MSDFQVLRPNQMLRLSPVGRNKQDAVASKAAARSARSEFGVPGFHPSVPIWLRHFSYP